MNTASTFENSPKVTICWVSPDGFGMGVSVVEARLHEIGRRDYAQYTAVPYAIFTPKGARIKRKIQMSYQPYLVIVEGWGHDLKQDIWGENTSTSPDVEVRQARYSGHHSGWKTDMNAKITAKNLKILADFRE